MENINEYVKWLIIIAFTIFYYFQFKSKFDNSEYQLFFKTVNVTFYSASVIIWITDYLGSTFFGNTNVFPDLLLMSIGVSLIWFGGVYAINYLKHSRMAN